LPRQAGDRVSFETKQKHFYFKIRFLRRGSPRQLQLLDSITKARFISLFDDIFKWKCVLSSNPVLIRVGKTLFFSGMRQRAILTFVLLVGEVARVIRPGSGGLYEIPLSPSHSPNS